MISAALAILETDEQRNELALFYRNNRQRLYKIAFSQLKNAIDAEDAVMKVISIIADKPENFFSVPENKRSAYADVITKRVSYKMINKKTKISIENIDSVSEVVSEVSIDDFLLGNEAARELLDFIRTMSEGRRDALLLKALYNKSTSEIARILDISETATRKRLSDAKKLLKDFLERKNHE